MTEPKRSFSDWKTAGRQYALEKLPDLWEFQVEKLASDFAWRNEGILITPENLDGAYDDWISGNNPYSPHTLPHKRGEDGYDYEEDIKRRNSEGVREAFEYAVGQGMPEFAAIRFAEGSGKGHSLAYKGNRDFPALMEDWISGKNKYSPHHVPLNPENISEREIRWQELRESYKHLAKWEFELLLDQGLLGHHLDL